MRIELRVHGFYFLDLAYREGSYDLDEFMNEPDPYVSSLASDLMRFESLMAEWLPYSRYQYRCPPPVSASGDAINEPSPLA